jgi:putative membrane protein
VRSTVRVRDLLANERTFLAWLRTAVALMTFGFVVDKFDLFLHLRVYPVRPSGLRPWDSLFGVALVVLGVVVTAAATVHFARVRAGILRGDHRPAAVSPLPLWAAGLLTAVGLGLAAYLWRAPAS